MEVTSILDIYEKQYADLNRRFVICLLEKDNLSTEKEQMLIRIKNLENQKLNLSNEQIRKLEDKINIELQTKISQLTEEIDTLSFKKTEQNLSNAKLVGDYLISDFPAKPKKSLIIAVGFVTGFILSIFLVFFLNFIKATKEEK